MSRKFWEAFQKPLWRSSFLIKMQAKAFTFTRNKLFYRYFQWWGLGLEHPIFTAHLTGWFCNIKNQSIIDVAMVLWLCLCSFIFLGKREEGRGREGGGGERSQYKKGKKITGYFLHKSLKFFFYFCFNVFINYMWLIKNSLNVKIKH